MSSFLQTAQLQVPRFGGTKIWNGGAQSWKRRMIGWELRILKWIDKCRKNMSISSGSPKENKAAILCFRYSNYVTKPRYTPTCRHDIACANSMWASKVLRSLEDLWSLITSTNLHAQEWDFALRALFARTPHRPHDFHRPMPYWLISLLKSPHLELSNF